MRLTLMVTASLVVAHVALVWLWYATSMTGEMPVLSEAAIWLRRYGHLPVAVAYGVVVGLFIPKSPYACITALASVLAAISGVMHWLAGRVIFVDLGSPEGAALLVALSFAMFTPFGLLGAWCGRRLVALYRTGLTRRR